MTATIWELPVSSTAFLGPGATFEQRPKRAAAIRFSYESEDDRTCARTLLFEGVQAYKITYYAARYADMLEAYDRVVDRGQTAWLRELTDNSRRNGFPTQGVKHLMIMFDDGPCYEFVCESFRVEES